MRRGADERLFRERHSISRVYTEMALQIAADYAGLPDLRSMTLSEIRLFYEGSRKALRRATAPKPR